MRLLRIGSSGDLSLTADLHDDIPPYAILSHTWGSDEEEVNFDDMQGHGAKSKAGYAKLTFCQKQARKHGLEYFWIDTCCINKGRDAELSEALNSMFRWYAQAERCYVYLSDVSTRKRAADGGAEAAWESAFRKSRWFKRGWTLQELLAPQRVEFHSSNGEFLGSKSSLARLICEITSIPIPALLGAPLASFTLEERFSWAASRSTKRTEDQAYCLLGIFGIYMPPIYGEGKNSWARLVKEINDQLRPESQTGRYLKSADYRSLADHINRADYAEYGSQAKKREVLTNSLHFPEMESRKETIKAAYSTTCEWFLEHPTYLSWLRHEGFEKPESFLWIKGTPGAGKSTLTKFLCSSAEEEERHANAGIVVSFFFNARGVDLERSTVGLYRSLLYQLLTKVPALQEVFDYVFYPQEDDSGAFTWSIGKLQILLSRAMANSQIPRIRCFIDALDECDEQQVREMILFWEAATERSLSGAHGLYVCLASRHYPTIDIHNGPQVILESQSEHDKDIEKYVRKHLRAGAEPFLEDVRKEISNRANGTFIWAVLVVEILNEEIRRGRNYVIRKRLLEIPPKLSDLFKTMIRRDGNNMEDMLLCLRLILFAARPLSPIEFYLAMMFGGSPQADELDELDLNNITKETILQRVLDSSKGFATITSGSEPTVQLIHESVRDFLIKDNGLNELSPTSEGQLESIGHEQLKQCCMAYLGELQRCFGLGDYVVGREALPSHISGKTGFMLYSINHLIYHADEAARDVNQVVFLKDLDTTSQWMTAMRNRTKPLKSHELEASLIHVLVFDRATRLIKTARENGWEHQLQEKYDDYPIFEAFRTGNEETVLALIQPLNCVHAKSKAMGLPQTRPLSSSNVCLSLEGHADRQSCSCSTNPNFTLRDGDGRDALSWAATKGFKRVTHLLLAAGLRDASSRDGDGRSPLSNAAQSGSLGVLQLLLDYGADVNGTDATGRTAVHWAHGPQVLQMLLDHKANIDAQQTNGTTALHHFSSSEFLPLARSLLQMGANVGVADADGHTPLHHASSRGDNAAVRLLLDHHADVEAVDKYGMTAAHWAATPGYLFSVKTLIEAGADFHKTDNRGKTPLMHSVRYNVAVARVILDQGVNVNVADEDGVTALMYTAQRRRRGAHMKELIERGADLNLRDHNGWTALSHASQVGLKGRVERLLEGGANVNVADNTGRTALMWAVGSGKDVSNPMPELEIETKHPYGLDGYQKQMILLAQAKKAAFLAGPQELDKASASELLANRLTIIRLLLGHGAEVNAMGNDGKTACVLAKERGFDSAVQLLKERGARE